MFSLIQAIIYVPLILLDGALWPLDVSVNLALLCKKGKV